MRGKNNSSRGKQVSGVDGFMYPDKLQDFASNTFMVGIHPSLVEWNFLSNLRDVDKIFHSLSAISCMTEFSSEKIGRL